MKAYGIGYGQGSWHNEHFTTEEARDARAAKLQQEIEEKFNLDFNGKYGVFTPSGNGTLGMTQVVIANIKNNGEYGAFRFTIRRYTYDRPACTWACTACESLKTEASKNVA